MQITKYFCEKCKKELKEGDVLGLYFFDCGKRHVFGFCKECLNYYFTEWGYKNV